MIILLATALDTRIGFRPFGESHKVADNVALIKCLEINDKEKEEKVAIIGLLTLSVFKKEVYSPELNCTTKLSGWEGV